MMESMKVNPNRPAYLLSPAVLEGTLMPVHILCSVAEEEPWRSSGSWQGGDPGKGTPGLVLK